jgi:hypothetical protein
MAMTTNVHVDVVDCAPHIPSPSESVKTPTMSHSLVNDLVISASSSRGADDCIISDKPEVALLLKLLKLPLLESKQ